jgi:hypothetical protein
VVLARLLLQQEPLLQPHLQALQQVNLSCVCAPIKTHKRRGPATLCWPISVLA